MILRQNVRTRPVVVISVLLLVFLSTALLSQGTGHGRQISADLLDKLTKGTDRVNDSQTSLHASSESQFSPASPSRTPSSHVTAPTHEHVPVSGDGSMLPFIPDEEGGMNMHLLLPASNGEINLCKTIMTAHVLGYPTPTLIGYNETYEHSVGMMAGGSHVLKILGVLEYLEALDSSADNDLVMMMDAYDIWFQLPQATLVSRYHAINAAANARLRERLGRAVDKEGIKQTIIFGAGKRCAPNQVHTVACYPIPETPLPDDIYGRNTDTIMGRNKYTSLRQRWLNSGFILGPAKDLRPLFQRALEKVRETKDFPEWDNGSHGSDFMYHGSDQSIFNIILGEQEFQRWVMRLRHLTPEDKAKGMDKLPSTYIEGTLIDNPINPRFTHEPMEHKDGKPDEFSIGLDYFSHLGQQTVNSDDDARWITHAMKPEEQIKDRNGLFDCPSRVTGELPEDILASGTEYLTVDNGHGQIPFSGWKDVPLYTNLCLNTIPVMVHHNGAKETREVAWPELWLQPYARTFMRGVLDDREGKAKKGGVHLKDGRWLPWKELCPAEFEGELFRDVD